MTEFPIRNFLRHNIYNRIRSFPISWWSKLNNTLACSMQSLIFTNYNILSTFPFESSLSCNNVIRLYFFSTKLLQPKIIWIWYPKRLPLESRPFCVDDACIFEAKYFKDWVIKGLRRGNVDILANVRIILFIILFCFCYVLWAYLILSILCIC